MRVQAYETGHTISFSQTPSGMGRRIHFIQNGVVDEKIAVSPSGSRNERMLSSIKPTVNKNSMF